MNHPLELLTAHLIEPSLLTLTTHLQQLENSQRGLRSTLDKLAHTLGETQRNLNSSQVEVHYDRVKALESKLQHIENIYIKITNRISAWENISVDGIQLGDLLRDNSEDENGNGNVNGDADADANADAGRLHIQ